MVDNINIDPESVDLATRLNEVLSSLSDKLDKAGNSFESFNKSVSSKKIAELNKPVLELNDAFEYFVQNLKDLPEDVLTGKDLFGEMLKDADLFNRIQQETIDLSKRLATEGFEEQRSAIEEVIESLKEKEKIVNQGFDDWDDRYKDLLDNFKDEQGWYEELGKLNEERGLIQESIDEKLKKIADEKLEVYEDLSEALDAHQKILEKIPADVERQFAVHKRNHEILEKQKELYVNITQEINKLGASIRNPRQAFSGLLNTMGDMPKKLAEAKNETGSWAGAFKEVTKNSRLGMMAKQLGKGGAIVIGLTAAAAAVTVLFKLFSNFWDFLDKKVIPAEAEFNKQIGGSGEAVGRLKNQTMAAGVQMERLGFSFSEGTKLVTGFAAGMKTVELDPKTLKTGMELQSILGLSGEQAGKLGLQFMKAEGDLDGLNEMFNVGHKEAQKYGLSTNQVLNDIATAPNIIARFGVANKVAMIEATARANNFGLSIKEVTAAFGKQMDTFDNTAKVSASLNAVFGTNINSMKLMMEQDPTKRMEMLRKELVKQGKEWGNLTPIQRNVITSQMGVDEQTAALILSSEKERKKLKAKADARKKEIKVNESWNKGINSVKKTLIAWGTEVDIIMRKFTKFVAALFGFESPSKMMRAAAAKVKDIFSKVGATVTSLTKTLKKFWKDWEEGGDKLGAFGKTVKFVWTILKTGAKVIAGGIVLHLKGLWKVVEGLWWVIKKAAEGWKLFFDITGATEGFKIIAGWLDDWTKKIEEFFDMDVDWGQVFDGFMLTIEEMLGINIDWGQIWKGFLLTLEDAWKSAKLLFSKFYKFVSDTFDDIVDVVKSVGEKVFGFLKWYFIDNPIKQFWNLLGFIDNFFGTDLTGIVKDALGKISSVLSDMWDPISTGIKDAYAKVKEVIMEMISWVKGKLKVITAPLSSIKDKISSFFSGDTEVEKIGKGSTIKVLQDAIKQGKFAGSEDKLSKGDIEDLKDILREKSMKKNDVLITKKGDIVDFNPNDNIFATKIPLPEMLPKPDAAMSINQEVVSEIKALRALLSAPQKTEAAPPVAVLEPKIEVISFEIDGREIAKAQVKIAASGVG